MPTFANDSETTALFIFYNVITRFNVRREIITNHGTNFKNRMMTKLVAKFGFL
jgi:hypothetical protein